jgi:hypothetical protein
MMPSSSKKQADFMRAVAHSPSFAKKTGVPMSVGKDFATADKGKKFSKGGDMKEDMKMDKAQDKAMIKKAFKQHDAQEHKGGKGTSLKLAKGGTFRSAANGIVQRGKTKGTQIKMNKGGMPC